MVRFIEATPEEMDVVMKQMATMLKEEDLRRKYLGDEHDWYMEHQHEFISSLNNGQTAKQQNN